MLAVCSVVVGVVLVLSPVASLGGLVVVVVVGLLLAAAQDFMRTPRLEVGEEGGAPSDPSRRTTWLSGAALVTAAVVVALWPGVTLRVVVLAVGLALLLSGGARLVAGIRGLSDVRAAAVLEGAAVMVLGVLALVWPDLTLFVVSVVLGARLVLLGLATLLRMLRGRPAGAAAGGRRPWWRRWLRTAAAAVALLLVVALVGLSVVLRSDAPEVDAFYEPPEEVTDEPGVLLRAETFGRSVPDGARAWRILYTTTRQDGEPAVASGLVVAPVSSDGQAPVVAWAHGTTGASPRCAPSLAAEPFEAGAMFVVDQVVEQGWVMVATDYVGLGSEGPHPYLVGQPEGRSVLDSVRAARQLPDLRLSDQTVVWGHSQGGHAALWAGVLAPDYAPDAGVLAVAALAPASDLPGLVGNLDEITGGSLFVSYVVQGYTSTYDDVDEGDYVRAGASVLVDELAARCLGERQVVVSIVESVAVDEPLLRRPLTEGPFGRRLAENVPSADIAVPLLIGQGAADQLVLPTAQQAYVDARCAAGGQVDYRTYEGLDHVPVVEPDSPLIPELLDWTQARLDGEPAASTC